MYMSVLLCAVLCAVVCLLLQLLLLLLVSSSSFSSLRCFCCSVCILTVKLCRNQTISVCL
jgi:hypothetical protein